MAKQTGPNFFIGTIGIVCFYKRGSQYLMRMKTSLTSEMVKKGSRFANTRKSAAELAIASRLASQVYRSLPKEKRNVALYRKMTGIAKVMLKEGKDVDMIINTLKDRLNPVPESHRPPTIDQQLAHRELSIAEHSRWVVNKEGSLICPIEVLPQKIQSPKRQERNRYFKISNRSITEIVDPVIDKSFLRLVDFTGFRRPRCGRYGKTHCEELAGEDSRQEIGVIFLNTIY